MNPCADERAVAATVPGAGVGNAGLRPPMVPRQASFFPPPVPNPFVQQTQLGVARRIQIFFLGIILLPIRALLVALILLLAWPLAAISTACYPEKLTHPITGWKSIQLCVLTWCQPFTRVEVEFMPVQVPSDEERSDPVLFASRIRSLMAEALKIPVTDHTYEDCRLMISAGQLTLPMEAGLVEFTKISRKLKLDWDGIRKHLDEYAAIASSSKGGRIGIEEFAEYLKLPVSDVLRQLFALFDRNHDGSIDFREYVIGLAVLCNPANTEEIIQVAFKLFDVDEDGFITEEEFSTILQASLGVPDLDVSGLFKEIAQGDSVSYEEFKSFALKHPEYAKIFTTYLDLQTCHVFSLPKEIQATPSVASNKVSPESHEESTSDKKED